MHRMCTVNHDSLIYLLVSNEWNSLHDVTVLMHAGFLCTVNHDSLIYLVSNEWSSLHDLLMHAGFRTTITITKLDFL